MWICGKLEIMLQGYLFAIDVLSNKTIILLSVA